MRAYMTVDAYTEDDLKFGAPSIQGWINPVWSLDPATVEDEPVAIASLFDPTDGAYDPERDGAVEEWQNAVADRWLGGWHDNGDGTFYGESDYSRGEYTLTLAIHFGEF